jgi:large subunit ribosomal protein L1
MLVKMNIKEALTELRKEENKRKFEQSVDLIVNLKGMNMKRDSLNIVVKIPNKIKEKKVCGFLSKKNELVKTITQPEFKKYSSKKMLKNLVNEYDYFISEAPLMPKVATEFGKVLGPVGKMPSPQLGLLPPNAPDAAIKAVLAKIDKSIKIRMKEASIKVISGREGMNDEEISENISAIYKEIVNALPNKQENVKNIMIKLTMTKPLRVEVGK